MVAGQFTVICVVPSAAFHVVLTWPVPTVALAYVDVSKDTVGVALSLQLTVKLPEVVGYVSVPLAAPKVVVPLILLTVTLYVLEPLR